MHQSFAMNGGDGTYSYSNNSTWQRNGANAVKDLIMEAVINNLDIETMSMYGSDSGSGSGSGSSPVTFTIADYGCSVGPNTFYAMQTLIESVQRKYGRTSNDTGLEFQVFFNDKLGNDFNTLFASLPQPRNYRAAGVPGSFNTRLFPSASIRIAYSSSALHWLSKVPEAVQERGSPAWNAGKIHCTGAPGPVVRAYEEQSEEDMEAFFRARAQEIVHGGMVVILMPGVLQRDVHHHGCVSLTFLELILIEMVKEGVIEQDKVDTFNIPIMFPCITDVKKVVERNGCFEIVRMEIMDGGPAEAGGESVIMHIRAAFEGSLANHFGKEMVEQIFERAMEKKLEFTRTLDSFKIGVADLLFLVLKRK